MGLTKINFNDIKNTSETDDIINVDKSVSLKQQTILPNNPPPTEFDGAIWVDPSTNNLKVKINAAIYEVSPQTDFNNITIDTPYTFPLNGNVGIVNNLTISGTGTAVNFRSSSTGGAQWSVLEIKGNLTVASGCTLNLIRTPLIVRGSIIGSGIITSPNGVNGGTGGVGGPGGSGGAGSISENSPTPVGINSPSIWPNNIGGSALSMSVEYGVNSGAGGPGGRGTAGGGGGSAVHAVYNIGGFNAMTGSPPGGSSGNGNPGGSGYPFAQIDSVNTDVYVYGAGGGGAGGNGQSGTYTFGSGLGPIRAGGPTANATNGTPGGSASILSTPYVGLGTPSNNLSGIAGTSGGAGGNGALLGYSASDFREVIPLYYNQSTLYEGDWFFRSYGSPGSPGGTGGNGGAGGGTGGAHISILCAGTVSSSLTIRPGKGGLTGGSTSLPRAQTGSLWLFTPTGSESVPGIDLNGAIGIPIGLSGNSNRFALSNGVALNDFFTGILYEANGPTVAKTKIAITYS